MVLALFTLGVVKAKFTQQTKWKSGLEMVFNGRSQISLTNKYLYIFLPILLCATTLNEQNDPKLKPRIQPY